MSNHLFSSIMVTAPEHQMKQNQNEANNTDSYNFGEPINRGKQTTERTMKQDLNPMEAS